MLKKLAPVFVLLVAATTLLGQTATNTVVLGADRDNSLFESVSGSLSGGAMDGTFVGRSGINGVRRGLYRFDVAGSIPAAARIESVTLSLQLLVTNGLDVDVDVHRVLADWGEAGSNSGGGVGPGSGGGGGAPAQPGDVTWIHTFTPGSFWTNVGGDFDPVPSATTTVPSIPAQYTWSGPNMVDDVQAWLDNPSSNFGWLLKTNELVQGQARKFGSRENATMSFRPVLTIDYVARAGSGEDFVISAGINSLPAFNPNLTATAGDGLLIHLESPMGGYDFFPHVLTGQLYNNGTPPFQSPFFPELYLDFNPGSFFPVLYLYSAFTNPFSTAFLPPGGQTFGFVIPNGLVGMSFMIQGFSALGSTNTGNPSFTATDAFSVKFI